MTTDNNITITMQDVEVVRQINPAFSEQLAIAAVSRIRSEGTGSCECGGDQ